MKKVIEVEVTEQHQSLVRKGIYYTTVMVGGTPAKVITHKKHNVGDKLKVVNTGAVGDGLRLEEVK